MSAWWILATFIAVGVTAFICAITYPYDKE